VSKKNDKVARLIASHHGRDLDPHYLGYFDCFNRQLFFEAHEVLEELWLPQRHGPGGDFYKGLIQLAGAFVHVQKSRPGPAIALLKLARRNLGKYPPIHQQLDVASLTMMIDAWLVRIGSGETANGGFGSGNAPELGLLSVKA
jgi:predicted metal-dependent hydrolase